MARGDMAKIIADKNYSAMMTMLNQYRLCALVNLFSIASHADDMK